MSNEKTIRIFIGSSITELELERAKLMSFIQGLNNRYHKRGIFIEGYICEETPNNMRIGGSQAMHNDYINSVADATVFMFYNKAGEFTMQELELARQAFVEKGVPNIYVFFKSVDGAPAINDDIQKAVRLVFNDYGHYPKMFNDVDTVKLELLQFLVELLPGNGELVVKNGEIYINGELVNDIKAENIFAYQNNSELKKLKSQIESLRKLELEAAEKGDETSALKFSVSRGKLEKQYSELESDILDALKFFFAENKKGKADPVLAEAMKQLELGNIDMAKALIPQEDLDRMAKSVAKRRALAEAAFRDEEETLLSHTRARIKALTLDRENIDRFTEIERAYENAYEAAKNVNDHDFIYDYASFLRRQKNYPKSIEIAEKLKYFYDDPDNQSRIDDKDRANLLNLLGVLYSDNNDLQKAEAVYRKSIAFWRNIFNAEPTAENENNVAMVCNNLGTFYSDNGNPSEAEILYLEAIEIYKRLAETVSREAYEPDVAMTCNNLGSFYSNNGNPAEAEKLYLEGLEIRRRLANTVSREANEPDMATTCNNLGNFYSDNGNPSEAEKLYLEALEIRRRLAETVSREAYEPDVAGTCNNLGIFYQNNGNPAEAEKLYLEALEIYKRFTETVSREAYEPYVATTCNSLGVFYSENGNHAEAEKLLLEALEIRRRLAETVSRKAYEPYVATICNNLGNLYSENGNPVEAEKLYLEALEIKRRLADTVSREAYEPYVATTCNSLGNFYSNNGNPTEAEKLLLEALEIRRRLAETVSREAYEPDVAGTCIDLGIFYQDNGNPAEAERLYLEALKIYQRLSKTVSLEAYDPDVAEICNNLGDFYSDNGSLAEAEVFYLVARDIYKNLTETVNREAYEPDMARTLFNLGLFYYKKIGDHEKGLLYLNESREIAERYKDVDPLCREIWEDLK